MDLILLMIIVMVELIMYNHLNLSLNSIFILMSCFMVRVTGGTLCWRCGGRRCWSGGVLWMLGGILRVMGLGGISCRVSVNHCS